MMTGTRSSSAIAKAFTVRVYVSSTEEGDSTTMGWSPCVPQRACITSPCEGDVGIPVDGPTRWMFTMTQGVSVMAA
jgi:hypothetical protein